MPKCRRPKHSRKEGIKGQKSQRGKADNKRGVKKEILPTRLTPTALNELNSFADSRNISCSELLEQIMEIGSDQISILESIHKQHKQNTHSPQERTKRVRGDIVNPFGERKKATSYSLTPQAHAAIHYLAQELRIDKNCCLEYIARSLQVIEPLLAESNACSESSNQSDWGSFSALKTAYKADISRI